MNSEENGNGLVRIVAQDIPRKLDYERFSESAYKNLGQLVDDYQKDLSIVPGREFNPESVFIAGDYKGAAVAMTTDFGVIYIDKWFSDDKRNGIGTKIANELRKCYDKVFLRCRKNNEDGKFFYDKIFGEGNRIDIDDEWYLYHWNLDEEEKRQALKFASERRKTVIH